MRETPAPVQEVIDLIADELNTARENDSVSCLD